MSFKFNIGDHITIKDSVKISKALWNKDGYIKNKKTSGEITGDDSFYSTWWYLIYIDVLDRNHWLPEYVISLHVDQLRDDKLNDLGL